MRIAMTKLSARCRELLHLLFSDEDFSYQEIADLLGRPIGSLGAAAGAVPRPTAGAPRCGVTYQSRPRQPFRWVGGGDSDD